MLRIERSERKVKCDQILLDNKIWTTQEYCVLSIICQNTKKEYQFSKEEWDTFPLLSEKRVIRLNLLRIFLGDSSATTSTNTDIMEVEKERVFSRERKGDVSISVVSVAQYQEGEEDYNLLLLYISILFDYHLLREDLGQIYQTTHSDKFWKYIQRQTQMNYGRMSYLFISTLIAIEPLPHKPSPLVKLWLDVELLHFKRAINSEEYRKDFISNVLPSHLKKILAHPITSQWQHARWHLFVLDGKLWLQNRAQYLVSVYWLIQMGKPTANVPDGERKGFVWIKEDTFREKFLPAVYEKYLQDLLALLRYQVLKKPTDYSEYYGFAQTLTKALKWEFLDGALVNCFALQSQDLYHFNLTRAENHASPVMKLFMTTEGLEERLGMKKTRTGKSKIFQKSGPPSDVMDIEDLFKDPVQLLPPCLSELVNKSKKDWCKYRDRLTLVKFLVDMGYEEKIVDLMSVNRNNAFDRREVENLVKSYTKKKQSSEGGAVSVYCGTIINSISSKEEIIRCKYEEALNGKKRVHSSDDEKGRFTSECACSVGLSSMNHPLDYIEQKTLLVKNQHKINKTS